MPHRQEMHDAQMSVAFGVVMALFARTAMAAHARTASEIAVTLATLAIIVCIWWWYTRLGNAFPSTTLVDHSLDYLMPVALCWMSISMTSISYWIVGWTMSSLVAIAKLLLVLTRTSWYEELPDIAAGLRPSLWVALSSLLLVVAVSGHAWHVVMHHSEAPRIECIAWVWLPITLGVAATVVASYKFMRKVV